MRDLALTSSCLHLFIVANKTENIVRDRDSKPGPLAWKSTPLALSYAHLISPNVRNYASVSYCAIRTAIAPAHFSPGFVLCFLKASHHHWEMPQLWQHFPMNCSKIGHSYEAFTYPFDRNIFIRLPSENKNSAEYLWKLAIMGKFG